MRDEVTIAVLSAVNPPLGACIGAVRKAVTEGSAEGIVYVKDVFPMSLAFNTMVDRCPSKFILQVDGDVVIEPWAVQTLYEAIRHRPWTYMVWGQLWEDYGKEFFEPGGALRLWRRWPLRLCRFRDRRCVDRDLHARIRLLGMRRRQVAPNRKFGLHCPRHTPFARFSKAKNDCLKWSVLGRSDLIESFYADVDISKFASPVPEALGLLAASLCTKRARSKNLQDDWWEYQRLMNEHRLHDADLILR